MYSVVVESSLPPPPPLSIIATTTRTIVARATVGRLKISKQVDCAHRLAQDGCLLTSIGLHFCFMNEFSAIAIESLDQWRSVCVQMTFCRELNEYLFRNSIRVVVGCGERERE